MKVRTSSHKWAYSGDVNMLDYGGKNTRHVGKRQFQVIELINMDEACGRDNKGQSKYVVELRLVDLDALSEDTLQSALRCCGQENETDMSDDCKAECCDSYGAHAPLETWNGNNARQLLRQAYREANALLDADTLSERMERPVNKIGSTALEFMQGNIMAPLQRGVESGDPNARIMAKMYGVPQQTIDDTRPDDFLPYVLGYMAGMSGGTKETDPDTAKEYFRGYDRGVAVKAGTCPAPSWITQP